MGYGDARQQRTLSFLYSFYKFSFPSNSVDHQMTRKNIIAGIN